MPDISPASVMNWHLCEIREKPRSLWTLSFTVGDVIWVRPNEGTGKEEEASEAGKEGRKERGKEGHISKGKGLFWRKVHQRGNQRTNEPTKKDETFLPRSEHFLPPSQTVQTFAKLPLALSLPLVSCE